jgi:ParB-like chromosome segregation protein Spo0J
MEPRTNKFAPAPEIPLAVVWRRIDELKSDSKPPQTHSRERIRQLAKSIGTFGLNVPILIGTGSQIIAGYSRLLAAQELGWSEVPTILLDQLSPAQAHAFVTADDHLAETASWGDLLLAMRLKELSPTELRIGDARRRAPGRLRRNRQTLPRPARSSAVGKA